MSAREVPICLLLEDRNDRFALQRLLASTRGAVRTADRFEEALEMMKGQPGLLITSGSTLPAGALGRAERLDPPPAVLLLADDDAPLFEEPETIDVLAGSTSASVAILHRPLRPSTAETVVRQVSALLDRILHPPEPDSSEPDSRESASRESDFRQSASAHSGSSNPEPRASGSPASNASASNASASNVPESNAPASNASGSTGPSRADAAGRRSGGAAPEVLERFGFGYVSRSAPADPVRLSPRAQSLTGLSGRVSTVAALLRRVDRDDRRSLVAAIRRALSERSAKDRSPEQGDPGRPSRPALESTVRIGGSGSRRWIRVRAAPQGDAPSSALDRGGWEAVLEDVTARQRTEQQRTEQIETLRADLAASARRVRHLAERLTDAEETERQRIASVLHDDLQPLVYGARVQIDTLRTQMEEGVVALDEFPDDAPPPREQLNGLSTQLKQAVSLTRSLSSTIRPPVLHSSSFADALQWLTVRVEETLGADVDLDLPRGMDIEGQGRRAFLFEAIRESVFNAVRHGEADRVVIRARQSSERTRVVIEDEGQGFDPEVLDDDASGDLRFGIRAIRQRLDDLGGRFRIDSAPDVGTRVMLTLPRRSAAPDESSG